MRDFFNSLIIDEEVFIKGWGIDEENLNFPLHASVISESLDFGGIEERDVSRLILGDEDLRLSIERARKELKQGSPYFTHEEVFD